MDYQTFVANKLQFVPPTGMEGRRFVGAELKASYYRQAVANLESAANVAQATMFETA